jgi:hypothetical protein
MASLIFVNPISSQPRVKSRGRFLNCLQVSLGYCAEGSTCPL